MGPRRRQVPVEHEGDETTRREWRKPTRIEPVLETQSAFVTYTEIHVREGDEIEINIVDSVEEGVPVVLEKPDFLDEDGTYLLGTMPEGEDDEIFEVVVRADNT